MIFWIWVVNVWRTDQTKSSTAGNRTLYTGSTHNVYHYTKVSRSKNGKEESDDEVDDAADGDNDDDNFESKWNLSTFDFQINETYTTYCVIFL